MTRFYKLNKNLVDRRYKIFKSKVNMSYAEMVAWKKEPCAYSASIKVKEVINRVTRLLKKPKTTWTQKDYIDSGKVISYISRASKIKDSSKPANKKLGCLKGKNFYALKNWAYDRKKERKNPYDADLLSKIKIIKELKHLDFANDDLIIYHVTLNSQTIGYAEYIVGKNFVFYVYVEPDYRRKGVADYLYDYIEKDQGITLRSNESTKNSKAFWQNRLVRKALTRQQ